MLSSNEEDIGLFFKSKWKKKRKEKKSFFKSCENQGFIISKIHGFCFGISQSFFILMQEKLCGKDCSNVAMKRVVAKRI